MLTGPLKLRRMNNCLHRLTTLVYERMLVHKLIAEKERRINKRKKDNEEEEE